MENRQINTAKHLKSNKNDNLRDQKTKNTKPQTNDYTIDNQKTQIYKFSVEKTGK